VFSVGVRRAPKEGSVAEWYEHQCQLQQLALERMKIREFPFGTGVDGVALQAGDIPMKMRIVMFEDGGWLWALTGMAPVTLWEDSVIVLSAMILSFALKEPAGQSAPVAPADDVAPPEE
jgi:hypothetical protein